MKEPVVSLQFELVGHEFGFVHSSMLMQLGPAKPVLQTQSNEPMVSLHCDVLGHVLRVRHSLILLQLSPPYPGLQSQLYEPMTFLHSEFDGQSKSPLLHSSISTHNPSKFSKPGLHSEFDG